MRARERLDYRKHHDGGSLVVLFGEAGVGIYVNRWAGDAKKKAGTRVSRLTVPRKQTNQSSS